MMTLSKIQPRPRLYDLTKLCPAGDEEPLSGFTESSLVDLQLAKSVTVAMMGSKLNQKERQFLERIVSLRGIVSREEQMNSKILNFMPLNIPVKT